VPRALDDYLATLPDGLRAFPRAEVKGNVLDEQLAWLDEVGVKLDRRIAPALRRAQPLGRSMEWVPEVLINAVSLNAMEAYPDEAGWIRAVYDRQLAYYRTPLYRALLMVMSPTLLTMGAERSWGAYRKGSTLKVDKWHKEGDSRITYGTLHHPAGLHMPLNLRGFAGTLHAAIDAAGAKESAVELLEDESAAGAARYRLSYRA
jgi:hypothetical protein